MVNKFVTGLAIILGAIMVFGLIQGTITGQFVKENEKIVIYFPESGDFPNPEEGTVIYEFGFPKASFRVGDKQADILMFVESEAVPGLKIGYDAVEKKVKGGLPIISSDEIELIDGKKHKLVYSFHKANQKQSIYVDGKKIAEGDYSGIEEQGSITGYAVYNKWTKMESPIGIKSTYS